MPTNHYFDTGTINEQMLYEDLIIEQLRIYGQDVYYLPRKIVNLDTIFGEDPLSSFNSSYLIEMYVDNVEGFEGEKELMTKFGLDIKFEITMVVAKRRWEQFISLDANLQESSRPNEGDLVYFPATKTLFEIAFVDEHEPFYQVQNLPTFKLKCRLFEYSSEDLDTGIEEIDNIENDNSLNMLNYNVLLEDGGSIILEESLPFGSPSYLINEEYVIQTIDERSQNDDFDLLDDTILNFDEKNPFGEIA